LKIMQLSIYFQDCRNNKSLFRQSVSLLFVLLNTQTSYEIVQIAHFLINWLISIQPLFAIDVSSSQHQIFYSSSSISLGLLISRTGNPNLRFSIQHFRCIIHTNHCITYPACSFFETVFQFPPLRQFF